MLDTSELRAIVVKTIADFAPSAAIASISDDTSLVELGIGSLALFHFVMTLESRLEISIPDTELAALNFKTMGTVLQTVTRLRDGGC